MPNAGSYRPVVSHSSAQRPSKRDNSVSLLIKTFFPAAAFAGHVGQQARGHPLQRRCRDTGGDEATSAHLMETGKAKLLCALSLVSSMLTTSFCC